MTYLSADQCFEARLLQVARKASTAYYPTLHLEIARYIAAAVRAGYELPWSVAKLIGSPPSAMCKTGSGSSGRASGAQGQASGHDGSTGSPRRVAAGHARSASALPGTSPQLPVPRKVTPMMFA